MYGYNKGLDIVKMWIELLISLFEYKEDTNQNKRLLIKYLKLKQKDLNISMFDKNKI